MLVSTYPAETVTNNAPHRSLLGVLDASHPGISRYIILLIYPSEIGYSTHLAHTGYLIARETVPIWSILTALVLQQLATPLTLQLPLVTTSAHHVTRRPGTFNSGNVVRQ